jgi:hypothetical protein
MPQILKATSMSGKPPAEKKKSLFMTQQKRDSLDYNFEYN